MNCTRRFLNFTWESHSWRRRVTASECLTTYETSMWGVDRLEAFVRCDKVEVCANCGKTRSPVTCLCGKEFGDHCVSRCAWIDRVADATL